MPTFLEPLKLKVSLVFDLQMIQITIGTQIQATLDNPHICQEVVVRFILISFLSPSMLTLTLPKTLEFEKEKHTGNVILETTT